MTDEKNENESSEEMETLQGSREFRKSGGGDVFEAPAHISEAEMETAEGETSTESSED